MHKSSFLETVKTVLSGFIGIRRKADHERAPLNPVHIIVAAVIAVALFIGTLVAIVQIVVK